MAAERWCHAYVALALMSFWGEVPMYSNLPMPVVVPENARGKTDLDEDSELLIKEWDLPRDFVQHVVAYTYE